MMYRLLYIAFITFSAVNVYAQDVVEFEVFEPGVISLEGISEGSPDVTADGNTLVFTRYQSYGDKVPYIAERTESGWDVRQLTFTDTLYNLAISPDGQRIVYKTRNRPSPGADRVNNAFRVDRNADGSWSDPVEMQPALKNAGYFRIANDGTLYLFINASDGEPRGIFTSELNSDGSYSDPVWLSDAVSPYPSVTYSPVINHDETKIIVNRAGLSEEEEQKLGERGLYIHQKYGFQWDTGRRLNLPYSWYAEVLPDGRLIFVENGDLYEASLEELGINWNE
ncbi:MAG: hypothetical protein GVY08_10935 [Bacteroidetes bacterium]|jgi:hypothetical protein|nr:hypothetical protein [Bacteroidota bacterium]